MSKIRKFMMGFVFALIAVMGVSAGSNDVKAASTKNFKGNLNATYKNSEWKSKITIKKINSEKVSVKVVANGLNQGSYNGTAISQNTINMKLDGGEEIVLKWKSKTSFTAKRPKGGFSNESIQMARLLCNSLNNTKYTQVQKSNTVYYGATYTNDDYYGADRVSKMILKGNKLIVKGSLVQATSKKNLSNENKRTLLKKATRTFKLDKNFKAYGHGEVDLEGNPIIEKFTNEELKSLLSGLNKSGGLSVEFIVKNGKLIRLNFCS